jgi:hypothetical protein
MPSKYDDDFVSNEEEYEAPRSRRSYRDDDAYDNDDEPVRRRSTKSIADDDDDDEPTTDKPRLTIRRGWGAVEAAKSADTPYAQSLKLGEDPVIIKFLEDEPYASYRQHWVERPGKKSFTCIADDPRGCPLCDSGNRPSTRFSFNVALWLDGDWVVRSYDVGPRVIDQLKNFHTDPRQGPLTKHYWAVSRTGKGASSATNHQMVKERDLDEEWKVDPIDDSASRTLIKGIYTADIIPVSTRKDLLSIVAEDA